ncbi:MAG: hypothetical protein HC848_04790 [Limnobacter sp.]|nr:hypothetical protein [Limnobacter sp.]
MTREVTEEFVPEALGKHIDLGLETPGHPVFIMGQRLMLSEMLKNLIENALRYTTSNGCVTVRVDNSPQRESIQLEVEDDGPGIPPNERHLVCDRFYRVLGTNQDGSGLGLSIVQETALRHHANLAIENNPRSARSNQPGCLIRITFPPVHLEQRVI